MVATAGCFFYALGQLPLAELFAISLTSPLFIAIFGALFLRRFVAPDVPWAHFDLYAWNVRERPGRPVGGEAQCLRLADRLIRERCG